MLTTQYLTNITDFEEMLDQTLTPVFNEESSARYWVVQCGVEKVDFVEVCGTTVDEVQPLCKENVYTTDVDTLRVFNMSGTQIIYIGDGQLIKARSVSFVRTYHYQNKSTSTSGKEEKIDVCGKMADIADCRTPLVEEIKQVSTPDGAPGIRYKGKLFVGDEVSYLPDDRILICSNYFASLDEPYISFSDQLTVLNAIGYSLSIAALFPTFINYLVFGVLRNVPGGAIMSLTAALFIAQLLTLTVLDKAENQTFCVAMAVLMHFAWLSTFTWMNALAFDLVRTFTSQLVSNHNKKKYFLAYCLYAWGVPLLIITACLIVHFTSAQSIGFQYGGARSCWLVGEYAILVAFGVPLVASLIANAVLFGLTVYSVHASLKAAAMVHSDKSKAKETTAELWIYFKVSYMQSFV